MSKKSSTSDDGPPAEREIQTEVVTPEVASASVPRRKKSTRRTLIEWLVVIIAALLASLVMRVYVIQTYFIPSASMEPTLQIGDRIIVSKMSLDFGSIHQGDIIVFKAPPSEHCGTSVPDLVKRVIALPGQTISLSKKGYVYINGTKLDETWLPESKQGTTYPGPTGTTYSLNSPYKVPANHYFMMGDNRSDSCDSRYWGPIPRSDVVGRAFLRIWPLSRFDFL